MYRVEEPSLDDLRFRQLETQILQRLETELNHQRKWRNRLVGISIVIAIVTSACFYFFSGNGAAVTAGQANVSKVVQQNVSQVRGGSSPTETLKTIYLAVANNDQRRGCAMFSPEVASIFASNAGTVNCYQAIELLHQKVTDPVQYKYFNISSTATLTSGSNSEISSCAIPVSHGPRLGLFGLRKQADGSWIVTRHENEPTDNCITG